MYNDSVQGGLHSIKKCVAGEGGTRGQLGLNFRISNKKAGDLEIWNKTAGALKDIVGKIPWRQ